MQTSSRRVIYTKHNATCVACGGMIYIGHPCLYDPSMPSGSKVMHPSCMDLDPRLLAAKEAIETAKKSEMDALRHAQQADLKEAKAEQKHALGVVLWWLAEAAKDPEVRETVREVIARQERLGHRPGEVVGTTATGRTLRAIG